MESQIKEKTEKILEITRNNICPRCLGRNYIEDVDGANNFERGLYVKNNIIRRFNAYDQKEEHCEICDDLLDYVDGPLIQKIRDVILRENIEFDTFLVGCRVPDNIIQKEERLQNFLGIEAESIKKEIRRELGKRLSLYLNKKVDFDYPDLIIMVDLKNDSIDLQIKPLFIEGRYRKLIRGIPQTKWPCRHCKGSGCSKCDFTGKMYQESVEELVSMEFMRWSSGKSSKFHGSGREDVDVRMLGSGRPFVLEIKDPHVRKIDLECISKIVNKKAKGKVEISDLRLVNRDRIREIKKSSTGTYKVYRALVEIEEEVDDTNLKALKSFDIINQSTPIRVLHRRANKLRKRKVKKVEFTRISPKKFELIIECEGGLYIKELISGDKNRTRPSVSSLLNTQAKCLELDVLDVKIS